MLILPNDLPTLSCIICICSVGSLSSLRSCCLRPEGVDKFAGSELSNAMQSACRWTSELSRILRVFYKLCRMPHAARCMLQVFSLSLSLSSLLYSTHFQLFLANLQGYLNCCEVFTCAVIVWKLLWIPNPPLPGCPFDPVPCLALPCTVSGTGHRWRFMQLHKCYFYLRKLQNKVITKSNLS